MLKHELRIATVPEGRCYRCMSWGVLTGVQSRVYGDEVTRKHRNVKSRSCRRHLTSPVRRVRCLLNGAHFRHVVPRQTVLFYTQTNIKTFSQTDAGSMHATDNAPKMETETAPSQFVIHKLQTWAARLATDNVNWTVISLKALKAS